MNAPLDIARRSSVCPHDCPSVCALDVDVIGGNRIGRVHGAPGHPFTQGVVCAKVARYSERIHHPDRLSRPLRRVGPKGSAQFVPISWDEALDCVAKAFLKVECEWGAEGVWPYFYAGTMGLVMRDGIDRLTHVKRYSRFFGNICVGIAWPGFIAGTGRMSGVSPSEMAKSEVVVIWGTNAAATQVNLMTHATRARCQAPSWNENMNVFWIWPSIVRISAGHVLAIDGSTGGPTAIRNLLPGKICRNFLTPQERCPAKMLKHRRIGRYTGQPCFDRQRLSPCRSKRRLIASSLLHPSSQARCFSSSSKTRYSASITPADFAKTFGAEILTIDG